MRYFNATCWTRVHTPPPINLMTSQRKENGFLINHFHSYLPYSLIFYTICCCASRTTSLCIDDLICFLTFACAYILLYLFSIPAYFIALHPSLFRDYSFIFYFLFYSFTLLFKQRLYFISAAFSTECIVG